MAEKSKDEKYIEKYFGTVSIFDKDNKGYVPLPIIYRKLLNLLTAPELRVLIYLMTRCSKAGLCYPSLEEIQHDLGLTSRRNLTPHLKGLEAKKFIITRTGNGKKFFVVQNPVEAVKHGLSTGTVTDDLLDEINQLLEDLKRSPIKR